MNRVLPSQVVTMIRERYPDVADHSNVGGSRDQSLLSGIVAAVEAIPNELIPIELSGRLTAILGTIHSAIRSWEAGGRHLHYISGRELRELREILAQCPDEPFPENEAVLSFITDDDFRRTLAVDIAAAHRALGHGEWKGATVLAGSVIEALCLWAIRARSTEQVARETAERLRREGRLDHGVPADLLKWHAPELIEVAGALQLIADDTARIAQTTKDYRNLIHPGREIRTGQRCTQGTAHVAIGTMERLVEDLAARA